MSRQVQKVTDSFVLTQVPDGSDCLVKHLPDELKLQDFWNRFPSGGVQRKPLQTVPRMVVFPQKVLPRKKEWKDDYVVNPTVADELTVLLPPTPSSEPIVKTPECMKESLADLQSKIPMAMPLPARVKLPTYICWMLFLGTVVSQTVVQLFSLIVSNTAITGASEIITARAVIMA